MGIEKREVSYAKEMDDVLVLVIQLLNTIKNKGDYTALIGALVTAVDGVTNIPEEFKDMDAFLSTVGYRMGQIPAIFLKKD